MSSSDPTFLVEVMIDDFRSYIKCNEFRIQCKFCDVFKLNIRDPRKEQHTKLMWKSAVRGLNTPKVAKRKQQTLQTTLFSCDACSLLSKMESIPMIIYLKQKTMTREKVCGSTKFSWRKPYLDYLRRNIFDKKSISDIKTTNKSIVFNDKIKQKVASFIISVKFSIVRNLDAIKYINDPLECRILQPKQTKEMLEEKFITCKSIRNDSKLNCLVKSETELNKKERVSIARVKSSPTIDIPRRLNILNYIFDCGKGPRVKQVYYVGYFTVEPEKNNAVPSNKSDNTSSSEGTCPFKTPDELNISQCKDVRCEIRTHRDVPTPNESKVLLNLDSMYKECCGVTEKTEQVVGGVKAKMQFGREPCFCTCECTFGFTRKTTYCDVCGGYEKFGDDLAHKSKLELPVPCPIFHKIVDKNKLKVLSTSGSDSLKKKDSAGLKTVKTASKSGTSSERRSGIEKKSGSEKDRKKSTKKLKDDRFKFNYGYKGIPPQIGHSQCAMPCKGTLGTVPKSMGWLWTAQDVPGIKFNPQWKPGAIHKFVHRLLKIAKNPETAVAKRKRKDNLKKRRPLKRPLLVVSKKSGEYTVTMETMKNYSKPRQINQQPYEDKPVLTYTIGRTEEENRARHKKKEREQRRLERAQRNFIQSAFQDMCQEICLKTYQQALGILPNAEDPKCPCYPTEPGPNNTNVNISCSCSEDSRSLSSDTDSDEWIVEFTPPNANFDLSFKGKKVLKVDNSSQYTYLDFRVKLVDRYGKPVPRFFKGPDAKQQCSDLGGFWSPDHKWLEINVDGFIGPDERWAPNIFTGPNGETVDAETGKFQAQNGRWLTVGVDGYVNEQGKWHFYPKSRSVMSQKKQAKTYDRKAIIRHAKEHNLKKTESTWSCLGKASPKKLSEMGITGHGADRKLLLKRLQDILAKGELVKMPETLTVLSVQKKGKKVGVQSLRKVASRGKCTHAVPSDKGIEAVDEYGNKTYFHLKRSKNKRPNQRIANLAKQGISLSSFHVPCLRSFISCEVMKKQQRERLKALAAKHADSIK